MNSSIQKDVVSDVSGNTNQSDFNSKFIENNNYVSKESNMETVNNFNDEITNIYLNFLNMTGLTGEYIKSMTRRNPMGKNDLLSIKDVVFTLNEHLQKGLLDMKLKNIRIIDGYFFYDPSGYEVECLKDFDIIYKEITICDLITSLYFTYNRNEDDHYPEEYITFSKIEMLYQFVDCIINQPNEVKIFPFHVHTDDDGGYTYPFYIIFTLEK